MSTRFHEQGLISFTKRDIVLEKTGMEIHRTLLNGFDAMPSGWKAWNYTAFILILQEEEKEERQGQDGLL